MKANTATVFGAVQDLAGRYEGAWTNTTFGSTGKAVIDIQTAGTNANVLFDLDGYVFGYVDPPLLSVPATIEGNMAYLDSKGVGILGDIKGVIDFTTSAFSLTLTNIPGNFIQQITATGTIQGGRISLDYTVDFFGPPSPTNPAHGVMVTTMTAPLKITRIGRQTSSVILDWTGRKGPYQIQTRTNLTLGTWINFGAATTNPSSNITMEQGAMSFFRVAGQ